MRMDAAHAANRARVERLIEDFEDMLRLSGDLHTSLDAVGRTYEQLRRTLVGAGRHDLVTRLKRMKEADTERLHDALGMRRRA